jgi:hypothetical protein
MSIETTIDKLANAGFEVVALPDMESFYLVARDGLAAFVQRHEDGSFGSSGNPGKLCHLGWTTFVWRGERNGAFVAKGAEVEATLDECNAVARFASELKQALQL